jgi:Heterokaryon incompatibility protein (HET)
MADQQLNERISSADTLDTFTYRPLQYNEVFSECRPVLECLSEDPEYAALSYTWGDADAKYAAAAYKTDVAAKTAIECDGASFMITNNLHAALCVLRDQHGVTAIWVDQICIDQENASEKGHQIQQM